MLPHLQFRVKASPPFPTDLELASPVYFLPLGFTFGFLPPPAPETSDSELYDCNKVRSQSLGKGKPPSKVSGSFLGWSWALVLERGLEETAAAATMVRPVAQE